MHKLLVSLCLGLWASWAVALAPSDGVRINEVYVAGPPSRSEQDGFIEFYNAGSATAYLDGAMVLQGLDTFAQLAFRFPGEPGGQTIAMAPGSFFVLATDAYNHAGLDPASPNLSYANVETALPQEPFPPDNASVENMVDVMGIGFEWFFVRRWGQVLLTTGETWWVRPCQPGEACGNLVCQVPLEEIVDGIEYLYALSGDSLPRLNNAIDAGIILGIEPWTGQSAERLTPGQDSDNSTDDFRVLALSTPGYQNALAVPQHPDPFVDTPLLLKAWPNPFNPELNVGLDVAERVVGRLAVFDVTGREVAVLHEGWMESGRREFRWRASLAASGTYWVVWQAAGNASHPLQVQLVK